MREELVLHCWDITGDDGAAQTRRAQSWMTEHSVDAVGVPLLKRGAAKLGLRGEESMNGRLRAPGTDDVIVTASADNTSIRLESPDAQAALETDTAARVVLLWGRRPGDPSRICSDAGPDLLGRVRTLLSGY